jgi:hypothetical protein
MNGHPQDRRACLKGAIGERAPFDMNEAADWGDFPEHSMLVILAFIVIAIYEIVARERDCRWILRTSPSVEAANGGGLNLGRGL